MSNMSHCRFENTYNDLEDCCNNMHDDDLDSREQNAKENLIRLSVEIATRYGSEVGLHVEEI